MGFYAFLAICAFCAILDFCDNFFLLVLVAKFGLNTVNLPEFASSQLLFVEGSCGLFGCHQDMCIGRGY